VLSALPLALLDRLRDLVDARLLRGEALGLKGLSATLTRAAHAVERLPGMRSGEDPATRIRSSKGFSWGTAAFLAVGAGSAAALILASRRQQRLGA
jgi:hypothetical protein